MGHTSVAQDEVYSLHLLLDVAQKRVQLHLDFWAFMTGTEPWPVLLAVLHDEPRIACIPQYCQRLCPQCRLDERCELGRSDRQKGGSTAASVAVCHISYDVACTTGCYSMFHLSCRFLADPAVTVRHGSGSSQLEISKRWARTRAAAASSLQ